MQSICWRKYNVGKSRVINKMCRKWKKPKGASNYTDWLNETVTTGEIQPRKKTSLKP
jgi:hypothetical protein